MDKFTNEDMPKWFGFLEKRVAKFGDGKHAVGNTLTVADLHLYSLMVYLASGIIEKSNGLEGKVEFSFYDSFPTLLAIFKNVDENPKIKEFYKR
jgi:glutathione S-transferase